MKITCLILCFLGLAVLAMADDAGFFVPKAFYKLDAEGHKSNVHQINPHQANILRRLRRQASSSSSSSSTIALSDGPVYYAQENSVKVSPGKLQSRFSGDDDDDDDSTGYVIRTQGAVHNGQVLYHDVQHKKL